MLPLLTFAILALPFFLVSSSPTKFSGCPVPDPTSLMNLPSGFPTPTGPLSYVSVAIGTQNYTCSSAGNYTLDGAVAELYDISCLTTDKAAFDKISDVAIDLWSKAPANVTTLKIISSCLKNPYVLGQHYYATNPVTHKGNSPIWDFTSSGATAGNPEAFVAAAAVYSVAAPTGSQDIDWVYLTNIGAGNLADGIYRTDTRLGQPPASCSLGSGSITVKYAAKYWLFGGSVKASY